MGARLIQESAAAADKRRDMATATEPSIETQLFGPAPSQPPAVPTASLISSMLDSGTGISDLIFSPGRPPQVERHGELQVVDIPQCSPLHPTDTAQIARDLIGGNEHPLEVLKKQG